MRAYLLLGVQALFWGHLGLPQETPLDGYVVNTNGNIVSGAKVSLMSLDHSDNGRPEIAVTDKDGEFRLNTKDGRYRIYIWNEALRVPNPRELIFESLSVKYPEIRVKSREGMHLGKFTLAAPYGSITLRVFDSKTKLPVPIARCTLRRADSPGVMFATDSTNGTFTFSLPQRPISLSVTSAGYKDWAYVSMSTSKSYLVTESDTETQINVPMDPK